MKIELDDVQVAVLNYAVDLLYRECKFDGRHDGKTITQEDFVQRKILLSTPERESPKTAEKVLLELTEILRSVIHPTTRSGIFT